MFEQPISTLCEASRPLRRRSQRWTRRRPIRWRRAARRRSPNTFCGKTCDNESSRLFSEQANGSQITRRYEAARRMNGDPLCVLSATLGAPCAALFAGRLAASERQFSELPIATLCRVQSIKPRDCRRHQPRTNTYCEANVSPGWLYAR